MDQPNPDTPFFHTKLSIFKYHNLFWWISLKALNLFLKINILFLHLIRNHMQESEQKNKKMNPDMKPEILSREMVKPSSPTPDHKRIHSLCFFEQLFTTVYMPTIFFYSDDPATRIAQKSFTLKESLSEALSSYYLLL